MSKCFPCKQDPFVEDVLDKILDTQSRMAEAKLPHISKDDGDDDEEEKEKADADELLDIWKDQNKVYSWEMDSGVRKFEKMVRVLGGYIDIYEFLADNPGACDAMEEFIQDHIEKVSEWEENLRDATGEHDEEGEDDD